MNDNNPVWVIADQENCNLLPVTPQLVGQARILADVLKTSVEVVLLGDGVGIHTEKLFASGTDRIYMGNDPDLATYHSEVYMDVIVKLAREHNPQIVLMGSTSAGRELAPLVAARLKTGLTAHCIDLSINQECILEQKIPAYGGEITIVCPERRPQMATVAQGVFPNPSPDGGRSGEIVSVRGPFLFSRADPNPGSRDGGTGWYPFRYSIMYSCGGGRSRRSRWLEPDCRIGNGIECGSGMHPACCG